MRARERSEPQATSLADRAGGWPVMVASLDVPFDPDAVVFAVDSAVELGQRLIVANFVERAPLPLWAMLGYDDLPYPPQLAESLRAPAELAHSLGVDEFRGRPQGFRRSEEHTSELQSPDHLVCRLLLEKKKKPLQHARCATRGICLRSWRQTII